MCKHQMFAHFINGCFQHVSHREFMTRCYGAENIVKVVVTERPDLPLPTEGMERTYLGWKEGGVGVPDFIQHTRVFFDCQFTYGFARAQQQGRGVAVVLDIELAPNDTDGA